MLVSGAAAVEAAAATGPPPPKTDGGATVALYATGMKNVTSMAWGDGAMFAGDSGGEGSVPNGGVYLVAAGKATKLPNGPAFVGGMAWHDNALYLSDAYLVKGGPTFRIERWADFNGHTFTKRQILITAPKGYQGFNGLAFGADGRLYVGSNSGLLDNNDHGPASTSPFLYDLLSVNARGTDMKLVATGIRQPWQIAFAPGSSSPFVSDLGQDGPRSVEARNPPDFLLKVKPGDNYGFPACNWTKGSPCGADAKPFKFFATHTSIMGLAVIDKTLYMGSFLGEGGRGGGALYSMPISGGKVTSVVTGFPAATDALAAHDGDLYVGGSTNKGVGLIYQVKP